jgi:1-acyl-sn-glycerol-3-phosphate acyltransferase
VLPPRWVRRLVLAPAVELVTFLLATTLPVWLIVVTALSPLLPLRRWRALRLLWFVFLQLAFESTALIVMFGLWVASGFGWKIRSPWFQRRHYAIVRVYLRVMYSEARRVLGVRVDVEGPQPSSYVGKPLLVFSRHAGPGDSFLLVHALITWYDREPRIVLKDTMQWDPAIDVVLNRLPTRFISPDPGASGDQVEAEIAELATNLDDNDAFVIFPEGGNFTARRRVRAIARLRSKGLEREARKAEAMQNVLAPRPGGVIAALAHAPEAEVVWVAHTGTDHLYSVADIWRELPMDQTIRMRWWQVPAEEVPRGRDTQIEWLYQWWARIDEWITQNRPVPTADRQPSRRDDPRTTAPEGQP